MGLGTRGCPISPAIKNDEIYKQHLLFVEANFLDFFFGEFGQIPNSLM